MPGMAEQVWSWLGIRREVTLVELMQFGPRPVRNARRARDVMRFLERRCLRRLPGGAEFRGRWRREAWEVVLWAF